MRRARWAALAPLLLAATAARADVPEQEAVRSGLRLGISGGLSLTPPPYCRACPYYRGLGGGVSLHAGWALHSNLAVDLAATASDISFADGTGYVLAIYDAGAVAYHDRTWIRLGAGAARWDLPVEPAERPDWRRWGGGMSLSVGRELGYSHLKFGVSARVLVATTGASFLSAVLLMCDLSRS